MVERVRYSEASNWNTVSARRWRARNRLHANEYMKLYMRFWRAKRRIEAINSMKDSERLSDFRQRELLRVKKRLVRSWQDCQEYVAKHEKERDKERIRERLEI